jgi:hypothetical protein
MTLEEPPGSDVFQVYVDYCGTEAAFTVAGKLEIATAPQLCSQTSKVPQSILPTLWSSTLSA